MNIKKLLFILLLILLIGCVEQRQKPTPKFKIGEIVYSIISKQQGQILNRYADYEYCYYDVRFSTVQEKTNTHLLSNDDAITTTLMRVNYMREYELKGEK